jgi:uncharacterized protein YerC
MSNQNRKHSIIDALSPELKWTVEQMLLTGSTYNDIVDYLAVNDISISMASICRYAKAYNANIQMLNIAQQNFARMMEELDKYPDLDSTEAIIRLTSQNVFNAIASTEEEEWSKIDKDKLLSSALGLVRAAAYKKKIDLQNKNELDTGIEAIKSMAFKAMAKEKPELFKEVSDYLNNMRDK